MIQLYELLQLYCTTSDELKNFRQMHFSRQTHKSLGTNFHILAAVRTVLQFESV